MTKINFGKDGERDDTKMVKGGYEDLLKTRKENMKDFQKTIQSVFDEWNGEPLAIVRMEEDENGQPTGSQVVIVGAGSPASSMRMAQSLDRASQQAVKSLAIETARLSKDDMMDVIKQVMEL